MRVLYVTKQLPFGGTEAFILPELEDHREAGWEIAIAPLTKGPLVHGVAAQWLDRTLVRSFISPSVLGALVAQLLSHPLALFRLLRDLLGVKSWRLKLRNLAVLPKGVWLGRAIRGRFDHIHVHWIAAPATLGMVASRVSGIPFSITAHRYDIAQNNLLDMKAREARFVRAIDEAGASEIAARLSDSTPRPIVLHMGVHVPTAPRPLPTPVAGRLRALVGARLTEKKGIETLLQAVALARQDGLTIDVTIYGDGPLETKLRDLAQRLNIADTIYWKGIASHEVLLKAIESGPFDCGILPSVTAADGDKEGIPVFLMEAMAAGLPVVTTRNGGIVELVGEDAAVVCDERDALGLCSALVDFASSAGERARLAERGRARILQSFEIETCMLELRRLISK